MRGISARGITLTVILIAFDAGFQAFVVVFEHVKLLLSFPLFNFNLIFNLKVFLKS